MITKNSLENTFAENITNITKGCNIAGENILQN